ncbi:MAG: hypothetical protein ACJ79S_09615 [Gemmatimonadaceae bacterium]
MRREIAAKRAEAEQIEQRCRDASKPFSDPRHCEHLLAEAARLRAEADREERQLAARAARAHTPQSPA